MTDTPIVDVDTLRDQVRDKYRAVAVDPDATYHFHTGRPLTARLGYDPAIVDAVARSQRSSRSPGSATRSRCANCAPGNASSTSAPALASTASSPPTTSAPTATSSVST